MHVNSVISYLDRLEADCAAGKPARRGRPTKAEQKARVTHQAWLITIMIEML